ncbi:MAG: hypothetical protein Q3972_08210 [Corynebacterium sp.]|nr:hypothetical protein [Corynebacterium sp.]
MSTEATQASALSLVLEIIEARLTAPNMRAISDAHIVPFIPQDKQTEFMHALRAQKQALTEQHQAQLLVHRFNQRLAAEREALGAVTDSHERFELQHDVRSVEKRIVVKEEELKAAERAATSATNKVLGLCTVFDAAGARRLVDLAQGDERATRLAALLDELGA